MGPSDTEINPSRPRNFCEDYNYTVWAGEGIKGSKADQGSGIKVLSRRVHALGCIDVTMCE